MKNVLRILILIIVGVTSLLLYFLLQEKTEYNQTVEIRKGQSISKSLKDLPVSKEFMFKLYLKFKNQGKILRLDTMNLREKFYNLSC